MFFDVLKLRDQLEEEFDSPEAAEVDRSMVGLLANEGQERLIGRLNEIVRYNSLKMMDTWRHLFEFLVVKHLDLATKVTEYDEDKMFDQFVKTPNGLAVSPERPGYPEAFRKQIIQEVGEKYLMK